MRDSGPSDEWGQPTEDRGRPRAVTNSSLIYAEAGNGGTHVEVRACDVEEDGFALHQRLLAQRGGLQGLLVGATERRVKT